MPVKSLSSPQNASYPMVVKKTMVAPGDMMEKGDLVYEIEDGAGQRIEVRTPIPGKVVQNTVPTGTVIEQASIILAIEELIEEAVFEVKKPAPAPAPSPEEPTPAPRAQQASTPQPSTAPAPSEKDDSSDYPALYGPIALFALSLCLVSLWAALHVTHSLASPWYRYGALLIGMCAPWFLYLPLPGKDRIKTKVEAYLGGLILGTLLNIVIASVSFFLPAQWLAKVDNQWVHQQLAPISFAPMLELEDRIYLLGKEIDETRSTETIPLSNGGALEFSIAYSPRNPQTGTIRYPDGLKGTHIKSYRIRVLESEDGETMIATYELPSWIESPDSPADNTWTYSLLDNTGRVLQVVEGVARIEETNESPMPAFTNEVLLGYESQRKQGRTGAKLEPR